MAFRGFWECILKVLNFLLVLVSLAMIGYGVYLYVEYKNSSSTNAHPPIGFLNEELVYLGRPMFFAISAADSIFDKLPKAWFIYLFTGLGGILLIVACCGCIGTSLRNGCCLTCYSIMIILLILAELGIAAFIFFDKRWREEIPDDRTGNFDMIHHFLEQNWKIIRWVALGIVIFEAIAFLLALIVRASNRPSDYDSDDEYIGGPSQQIRQPFISRKPPPAVGVPIVGTLDHRSIRNDAWSTRMREKYGLDTSEFTYNPSESNMHDQGAPQPSEERRCCIVM